MTEAKKKLMARKEEEEEEKAAAFGGNIFIRWKSGGGTFLWKENITRCRLRLCRCPKKGKT